MHGELCGIEAAQLKYRVGQPELMKASLVRSTKYLQYKTLQETWVWILQRFSELVSLWYVRFSLHSSLNGGVLHDMGHEQVRALVSRRRCPN